MFNKLIRKAGLSKKELAGLMNSPYSTVNGWGVSGKKVPVWVESWLKNYIELQEKNEELNELKENIIQNIKNNPKYKNFTDGEYEELYFVPLKEILDYYGYLRYLDTKANKTSFNNPNHHIDKVITIGEMQKTDLTKVYYNPADLKNTFDTIIKRLERLENK